MSAPKSYAAVAAATSPPTNTVKSTRQQPVNSAITPPPHEEKRSTRQPHSLTTTPPDTFHTPRTTTTTTQGQATAVYVLTLTTTPSIALPLDRLRTRYFPPRLNRIPAHITLFHALPHDRLATTVDADIAALAASTRPYRLSTGRPFRMTKGVAVRLGEGNARTEALRRALLDGWTGGCRHGTGTEVEDGCWLSRQDSKTRGWQPHWTVMNKVDEEEKVKKAFEDLKGQLHVEREHGKALGFTLWRYKVGGEWERVKNYPFSSSSSSKLVDPCI